MVAGDVGSSDGDSGTAAARAEAGRGIVAPPVCEAHSAFATTGGDTVSVPTTSSSYDVSLEAVD
jgi:hypothetical protein